MSFGVSLFRDKIFVALVLVTLLFLSLMATIDYFQYSKSIDARKKQQVMQVEDRVSETLQYLMHSDSTDKDSINTILKSRIFEFANVYNANINVYGLNGHLIASNIKLGDKLKPSLLDSVQREKSLIKVNYFKGKKVNAYNSYSYINIKDTPMAILNVNMLEDTTAANTLKQELAKQYLFLIIFLMVISGFVAWLISRKMTKKIAGISDKLKNTNIKGENVPLMYMEDDEILPLVDSYNRMLLQIRQQKFELQRSERGEAWKEMARQVAHEINNPLTPLKLTIQNFQRRFRMDDPQNGEKVNTLTESVVHQIDIISAITKSFSDFAKMPVNFDSETDVVDNLRKTLEIFPEGEVFFNTNVESLQYRIDGLYLTRIITNIVKNALQSIPDTQSKRVEVDVENFEKNFIIKVKDNGKGIPTEFQSKVFEANFTTKSSGMGLGLSMVKKIVEDYSGKIWFETSNKGTTFFIEFEKN